MILYRVARYMRGRWDWTTCSMHQGVAREYLEAACYTGLDYLVFAAPSITGLDYMLSLYNKGVRACCAGVEPFLTGEFDEVTADEIYSTILKGVPRTTGLREGMIERAMQEGMTRVLPPLPTRTIEGIWPKSVIRRLEFYKWMVGTGRLTEEIEA